MKPPQLRLRGFLNEIMSNNRKRSKRNQNKRSSGCHLINSNYRKINANNNDVARNDNEIIKLSDNAELDVGVNAANKHADNAVDMKITGASQLKQVRYIITYFSFNAYIEGFHVKRCVYIGNYLFG